MNDSQSSSRLESLQRVREIVLTNEDADLLTHISMTILYTDQNNRNERKGSSTSSDGEIRRKQRDAEIDKEITKRELE